MEKGRGRTETAQILVCALGVARGSRKNPVVLALSTIRPRPPSRSLFVSGVLNVAIWRERDDDVQGCGHCRPTFRRFAGMGVGPRFVALLASDNVSTFHGRRLGSDGDVVACPWGRRFRCLATTDSAKTTERADDSRVRLKPADPQPS